MIVHAWVVACRPATLSASVVPVVVGSAVAFSVGGFHLGLAVSALFGAMLLQIGSNLANDVYDYEKGADTDERLGPTRAVAAGLLTAQQVRLGMWVTFILAAGAGVYLTATAGPIIIIIGLASIAAAVLYTAGPMPLAYLGLGDLFVLIFFGFTAVVTTTYVQTGVTPELAWWAAVPIGTIATSILVVNNLRDRHTDYQARKMTLAARFGRRFAIAEYTLLLLSAYVVPVVLVFRGLASSWALLPLLTFPLAAWSGHRVARDDGATLNASLKRTSFLLLVYGLLFAAGIALETP